MVSRAHCGIPHVQQRLDFVYTAFVDEILPLCTITARTSGQPQVSSTHRVSWRPHAWYPPAQHS